jgi:hypothetical protein
MRVIYTLKGAMGMLGCALSIEKYGTSLIERKKTLLNVQNIPRRLKRKKPFELVTH